MKKKTMLLLLFVVSFAVVCVFIISSITKDTFTFDWLVNNSDYTIMATNSLPIEKTENPKYTVCYDLPLSEYYEKDGKRIIVTNAKEYEGKMPPYDLELVAYFEAKDWKNYTIQAHGMKSSSLSIGAKELSELAKKL